MDGSFGGEGSAAMGSYAWVEFDLRCPECEEVIDDVVWMPWGGVMSYDHSYGPTYRVGGRLLWFVDDHGRVPPDTSWRFRAMNAGSPMFRNVDVYTDQTPEACLRCGFEIACGVVAIRDGVIADVAVVAQGTKDPTVVAVVLDDETLEPREELYDRAVRMAGD